WIRDALSGLHADVGRYTSTEAADDLDDVREALGYDRIDLYGGSYGATLAQYYLRRHGEHARAVLLDGGTLLHVPVFELIARRSDRALASALERCRDDTACRSAYPDPTGDLASVTATLARDPVTVAVRTPVSTHDVVVTERAFAGAIHALLLESRSAEIPGLLRRAAGGDLSGIAAVVADRESDADGYRQLMTWAIRCSEPWAAFRPRRVSALGRGSYLVEEQLADALTTRLVCDVMPPLPDRGGDDEPVRSDVPVLLLNGTEDPQDPPANVAGAARQLTGSLTVAVPGYGHTVGHVGCLPQVVAAFLAAGGVDGLDTGCVAEMPAPSFELPSS
ncbi:MAG TPA: alpha/beta hydrolase, partial [Actinomycetota bacterium]|nr:alpha/beta hydrolase [Actinomycetota bacterium]